MRGGAWQSQGGHCSCTRVQWGPQIPACKSPAPGPRTWEPRGCRMGSQQWEPGWEQTAHVYTPLPGPSPFSLSTSPDGPSFIDQIWGEVNGYPKRGMGEM